MPVLPVDFFDEFFKQDFSWDPDWCTECAEADALARGVECGNGYSSPCPHGR